MFWQVNFYLARTIYDSYYTVVVPVLVAGVLYFRRLKDGTEYKLLLAYCLWFWISRALNGSPALDQDFRVVLELSLMLPFFALGFALTEKERVCFLNWLSGVVGGFYFILGLIALSAFLQRKMYVNPITGGYLGIVREADYARINILDIHANVTGYWFLMSLFLMIYQFFQCEKKLWRIPIVISAIVDLLVIAITYSRSVRLSMAVAFALLAAMLIWQLMQNRARLLRIIVALSLALAALIVAYEGSALSADVMGTLSYRITNTHPTADSINQAVYPDETAWSERSFDARAMLVATEKPIVFEAANMSGGLVHTDPRPKTGDLESLSSNRLQIWRSAFQAISVKPSILLKGQLCNDVMTVANTFTNHEETGGTPGHFHNSMIQVLMTTGLPGLILTTVFLVLLLYQGARFLLRGRAPLAARTLVLPVVASLPHFLLESGLFTSIDIRTLFYFLMCGMMMAFKRSESPERHIHEESR